MSSNAPPVATVWNSMSAGLLIVARRFVNLREMSPKIRKLIIRIPLVAILILIGWILFETLRPAPPLPLPNPNGYDDFVKAGQMLTGNFVNFTNLSAEKLRLLMTENGDAIKLGRLGLTRECRVPVQSSASWPSHKADMAALRALGIALSAEGRLAEIENRPSDALKSYLDCIRLGNQSASGGLFVDKLMGCAIEQTAINDIRNLGCIRLGNKSARKSARDGMDKLKDLTFEQLVALNDIPTMTNEVSLTEYRDAIQTLESLEANSESAEDISKRNEIWMRQIYSSRLAYWRERISSMIREKTLHPAGQIITIKQAIEAIEKERRKLLIDLAARAYELEKGERPKTIADLVPNYLKTIPLNPFTGTNIVYQP